MAAKKRKRRKTNSLRSAIRKAPTRLGGCYAAICVSRSTAANRGRGEAAAAAAGAARGAGPSGGGFRFRIAAKELIEHKEGRPASAKPSSASSLRALPSFASNEHTEPDRPSLS